MLEYLVEVKGLTPIIDLMHYGTPLWLDNHFVNASYPRRVAEYAARFAERYGSLVRYYTPLNEPAVTAAYLRPRRPMAAVPLGRRRLRQGPPGPGRGDDPDGRGAPRGPARRGPGPRRGRRPRVRRLAATWPTAAAAAQARPAPAARPGLRPGRARPPVSTTGSSSTARPRPSCDELAATAPRWDVLGVNFYPWSNRRFVRRRNGRVRSVATRPASAAGRRAPAGPRPLRPPADGHRDQLDRAPTSSGPAGCARPSPPSARSAAEGIPVLGYTWFPHVHDDRVEVPLVAQGAGGPPAPPRPLRRRAPRRPDGPRADPAGRPLPPLHRRPAPAVGECRPPSPSRPPTASPDPSDPRSPGLAQLPRP